MGRKMNNQTSVKDEIKMEKAIQPTTIDSLKSEITKLHHKIFILEAYYMEDLKRYYVIAKLLKTRGIKATRQSKLIFKK